MSSTCQSLQSIHTSRAIQRTVTQTALTTWSHDQSFSAAWLNVHAHYLAAINSRRHSTSTSSPVSDDVQPRLPVQSQTTFNLDFRSSLRRRSASNSSPVPDDVQPRLPVQSQTTFSLDFQSTLRRSQCARHDAHIFSNFIVGRAVQKDSCFYIVNERNVMQLCPMCLTVSPS